MKKLNTYGINVNAKALAAAARDTETNASGNNHVIYNTESGNVYNVWLVNDQHWTAPTDMDGFVLATVRCVAVTNKHMTRQQIMDCIRDSVAA